MKETSVTRCRRRQWLVRAACLWLLMPSAVLSMAGQNPAARIQNPESRLQDSQDAGQNPPPAARPPMPAMPAMIDPKAQDVLDKIIQALGGAAFLRFRTLTTHGRAFSITNGETSGLAPFDSVVEYPDKRRFSYGKSKPVILINDGDSAWELDKYGTIQQPPEQVRRWQLSNRYSLENLLRLRIHEAGILVQMGGVDFVDNLPARVLEMVDAEHVHIRLFINQRTFLPVRISYQILNPQTQEQDEYADIYADYRDIQGIQTPMHIARFVNDERVAETFRNSAQYDRGYPRDYFQPGGGNPEPQTP